MIEPIDFGVVNDITTNAPSFNECRSTINVTFIPNRPETWINLKKNIHDILDDPDGYVFCNVDDITKANNEILKLKDRVKELEGQLADAKKESDKRLCEVYMETNATLYSGAYSLIAIGKELEDLKKQAEQMEELEKENQALKDRLEQELSFMGDSYTKSIEKSRNYWEERCKFFETKHEAKWSAMLQTLKEKGVEVIYMGEEGGKPIIDVKIPEIGDLRKELEELKSKNIAEVRYEWHPDCFTVIYTKCDGTKETVGMDLAGDTDEKCTMGAFVCRSFNIPQCKKCKNHRYFANTGGHYCHLPDSKYAIPGMFHINPLTEEDAEGPACDKFEARKEN